MTTVQRLVARFVVPVVQWWNWHVRKLARCAECREVFSIKGMGKSPWCPECYTKKLWAFAEGQMHGTQEKKETD